MLKGFTGRQGVMLSLVAIIATLWLGVTGQLPLYIHPRYVTFAVIMAIIASTLALAGFVRTAPATHEPDTHDAHEPPRTGRLRAVGSLLTVTAAVLGLLVLPPTTLSSTTARQRDLNISGTLSRYQTSQLNTADTSTFTVRDWASLLRYNTGKTALPGKTATLTGFVTLDKSDPSNVFFITRFVVTCCTVDAQPVGVPVYRPGWQATYKTDTWVNATGTFRKNPGEDTTIPLVLMPTELTTTTQPGQPYVY